MAILESLAVDRSRLRDWVSLPIFRRKGIVVEEPARIRDEGGGENGKGIAMQRCGFRLRFCDPG